jgi:hypothetical protein
MPSQKLNQLKWSHLPVVQMSQEVLFGVIYNDDYGGFGYSQKAWDEYSKRTGKQVQSLSRLFGPRYDPVMIQIVKELGHEANGPYANLRIAYFSKEFENCLKIDEYDGKETVRIDQKAYSLEWIHRCLDTDESDSVKIGKIRQFFSEKPGHFGKVGFVHLQHPI